MLNLKILPKQDGIVVSRRTIDVVLIEDLLASLKLTVPPIEELQAARNLSLADISIKTTVQSVADVDAGFFANELVKLQNKVERFRKSPTYLGRLASLAFLAKRFDLEESFLREGLKIETGQFFAHRLGEALVDQRNTQEAKAVYRGMDLDSDIEANLRLAQLAAIDNNLVDAERHISKALEIDNSDHRVQMFAGALSLWRGHFEQAIRSFRVASEENNTSSSLHVNLAVAYYLLKQIPKTLTELLKAITLNPLNENALIFFADVLVELGEAGEAIRRLEAFLRYEQQSVWIWDRLARAYYLNKQYREALNSLNNQESLIDGPGVRNNMALVYWRLGKRKKAAEYFVLAVKKTEEQRQDPELPLSNLLSLLIDDEEYQKAYEISKRIVDLQRTDWGKKKFLSHIYLKHIIALDGMERHKDAAETARIMLDYEIADREIELHLLLYVVSHLTIFSLEKAEAVRYIDRLLSTVRSHLDLQETVMKRSLNNAMFSLLQFDFIQKAESIASRIARYVHQDPFVTATFGLLNIKRGKIDKGKGLYEEAFELANDNKLKRRIKQRMHLELGKALLETGDRTKAVRLLEKAVSEKLGFDYVKRESKALIASAR